MKIVNHFRLRCYVFLLALVFTSCIKEDLEICLPQPVNIDFAFIRSVDCPEEIANPEGVNRLTIFVFDDKGLFVQQVDTIPAGTNYQVELSLEPNIAYQFMGVAGYVDDQLRVEEIANAPFIPGITHIADAAVATYLEQRDGSLRSAEYILYKGNDSLTVVPETPGQELNITLIQRTKVLNFSVDGLNGDEGFQIVLAGNAAHYKFDDQQVFLTGNPLVHVPLEPGVDDYSAFGRSQVNWPLQREGFFTRLQIIDPETGYRLLDENLYELLDQVPGLNLECANSFDIGFVYTVDMKIRVYINQWLVSENGYELQ